jgi:hypothetical protein
MESWFFVGHQEWRRNHEGAPLARVFFFLCFGDRKANQILSQEVRGALDGMPRAPEHEARIIALPAELSPFSHDEQVTVVGKEGRRFG